MKKKTADNSEGIILIIGILSLMFLGVILLIQRIENLQEENKILQDKLNELNTTWTLKIECFDFAEIEYLYIEQELSSYEVYKETAELLMEIKEYRESCEVLE